MVDGRLHRASLAGLRFRDRFIEPGQYHGRRRRSRCDATPLGASLPDFDIAAGEETQRYCQSWTLNNDEPIFVNRVVVENTGAFHHSNWFFVLDRFYEGPDGTWPCAERGFDSVAAGSNSSGGVLFAQSTQALSEEQSFPEGTVVRLPPNVRLVGQVHLLNIQSEPVSTHIRMELHALPESEVLTQLSAMSFANWSLRIPPRSESTFSMDCDLSAATLGERWDARLYYFLPHYHQYGRQMRLEYVGGERDGTVLFETNSAIGEPLGQTLSPPMEMSGAEKIRLSCTFENPSDRTIRHGIGENEMCMFLAFTDSRYRIGAYGMNIEEQETTPDGVHQAQSDCIVAAIPIAR